MPTALPQGRARLRVDSLSARRPTAFEVTTTAESRDALARSLGLRAIRKLRFEGTLAPEGRDGWALSGTLGATIVQSCVVTLEPVTTRIDTPVVRRFLPHPEPEPTEAETEMPEDVSIEPLGNVIDLDALLAEELALAAPDYPRSAGADLSDATFAGPGVTPMTDEDVKPFAALKALRDRLKDG